MSYTKNDLRDAFYAGKLGNVSFDSWFLKSKKFNQLVSVYQQCFIKFLDMPSSYGLNVQTKECARLKHILRGFLMRNSRNITMDFIGEVEQGAGSLRKTNHTTIINSVKRFDESYQNHNITKQIKKIVEEYEN